MIKIDDDKGNIVLIDKCSNFRFYYTTFLIIKADIVNKAKFIQRIIVHFPYKLIDFPPRTDKNGLLLFMR